MVGAPGGAANGFSGSGQTIAVLDTGVDKNHDYFAGGKVVSEACYSTTTGTNPDFDSSVSVCPGGVSGIDRARFGIKLRHSANRRLLARHARRRNRRRQGHRTRTFRRGERRYDYRHSGFFSFNNPDNCGGFPPCIGGYNSDVIKGLERVYALRTTYQYRRREYELRRLLFQQLL